MGKGRRRGWGTWDPTNWQATGAGEDGAGVAAAMLGGEGCHHVDVTPAVAEPFTVWTTCLASRDAETGPPRVIDSL